MAELPAHRQQTPHINDNGSRRGSSRDRRKIPAASGADVGLLSRIEYDPAGGRLSPDRTALRRIESMTSRLDHEDAKVLEDFGETDRRGHER